MNFENIILEYRSPIREVIDEYLETEISTISSVHNPEIETFHREMYSDYLIRGGKYLRPIVLVLTSEAMGQQREKVLRTAAAMEFCQNWLLIHDDIEDKSIVRRGEPTLHQKYGIPLAVNAGDALHVLMWKVLCDNNEIIGIKKTLKVIGEFQKMLSRTLLGQTAELYYSYQSTYFASEDDYLYIVDGKTSCYTFAGPMRIGAILASDSDQELKSIFPLLNKLGIYLGRAFQIKDDLLDLRTDIRRIEQQSFDDIYEGRITLVLSHLLKNINGNERKKLVKVLTKQRESKTERDIHYILDLMNDKGSIDYAMLQAEMWASKAIDVFKQIRFFTNRDAKKKLESIFEFVIDRTY
jgi:geranylgeranyl diphosphate synthase, type II